MSRRSTNDRHASRHRRGRWAHAVSEMIEDGDYPELPDVGSGADPTSGAPAPFRGKGDRKSGRHLGSAR